MSDDSLRNYMSHVMSMRQITKAEIINAYWGAASSIAKTGKLAFIFQGDVSWKSERSEGIDDHKGLWLKSNRYDWEGKHIGEEPVRFYLQLYMSTYEIWGTITLNIDAKDASASKPFIEQAVERTTCVGNVICLLSGGSLRFRPAVYTYVRHEPLSQPPEQAVTKSWDCMPLHLPDELTAVIIKDGFITNSVLPLVYEVNNMPTAVKSMVGMAMDWHAQANRYGSGLNRFVNYWASMELLGNFFYPRLPVEIVGRKTREQKKSEICRLLGTVTEKNCMKIVDKCNEIREPSARTKISGFVSSIVEEVADRKRIEDQLFAPDEKSGKSLYAIRNDIAHGEISEHQFEQVGLLIPRLYDAKRISREIILRSIKYAKELDPLIG